jgi:hypothetical protein
MAIWKTSTPTTQDYPIWAYTEDSSEVVLIRSPEGRMGVYGRIVWCNAEIPSRPISAQQARFKELVESEDTTEWTAIDWFKAGYLYGNEDKGSGYIRKSQPNSGISPFVSPSDYWSNASISSANELDGDDPF